MIESRHTFVLLFSIHLSLTPSIACADTFLLCLSQIYSKSFLRYQSYHGYDSVLLYYLDFKSPHQRSHALHVVLLLFAHHLIFFTKLFSGYVTFIDRIFSPSVFFLNLFIYVPVLFKQ